MDLNTSHDHALQRLSVGTQAPLTLYNSLQNDRNQRDLRYLKYEAEKHSSEHQ